VEAVNDIYNPMPALAYTKSRVLSSKGGSPGSVAIILSEELEFAI
jgi:hypothetical protein